MWWICHVAKSDQVRPGNYPHSTTLGRGDMFRFRFTVSYSSFDTPTGLYDLSGPAAS
jgi:hypothetical protein